MAQNDSETTDRGATGDAPRRATNRRNLLLLGVIFVLAATIATLSPYRILEAALSPYGVFVMIVMIVEYLVLKSGDRTRAYRMENRKLRERRRELERLVRETEAALGRLPIEEGADGTLTNEQQERLRDLRERARALA